MLNHIEFDLALVCI